MSRIRSARPLPAKFAHARPGWLLLGPLGILLSGCVNDGAPLSVSLPATPPAYRSAAAVSAPSPDTNWPKSFGSAELTRLELQADTGNFDIAAAASQIEQAEAQASIAAASLGPTVDGTGGLSRSISPGTDRSKSAPFSTSASNSFSLGLTASYALDFFGKNRATVEAAKLSAQASHFDRDVIILSTEATLADSYFTILAAQDQLQIAQNNVQVANNVLKAIQARVSVGTGTALDLAQQQGVVATQQASIPPLRETIDQSKNAIAVLLGRTPETVNIVGGSLNRIATPSVKAGLPSALLLRRPDVASAETRLASAGANVRAARAAFFPSITLTGDTGFSSITLQNLLRPEALFASAAANLTAPIFDSGALQGQFDLNKGIYGELLEDYRKSIVSALSDVENALIAVRDTTDHERLQGETVAYAQKAYQITDAQLHQGTIDVTTLLTVQQTLFNAEETLSQIRLQRLQAIVSLYQALGGGWTYEGGYSRIAPLVGADAGSEEPSP